MVRLDDANATSVYGVSVDSRSRPANQPDNKYDISLGRTLDRVKSLQLGSIQIPDCRYAFDSKSVLQYSEPITIPANMHLFINEQVRTVNTASNTTTVENRVLHILVPPTLNRVIQYQAGGGADDGVVSALNPTGLQFALTYYPLVGLTPSIVGAHFPQTLMTLPMPAPFPSAAGPLLTTSTLAVNNGGYYEPDGYNVLDNGFQYTPGYLNALTTTAGNYDDRHVLTCAWSYIYSPRPTLTELFTMLNAALNAKLTTPDLTGSVTQVASSFGSLEITTAAAHGLHVGDQVVIAGTGVAGTEGTFFVRQVLSSTRFVVNVAHVGGAVPTPGATFASPQQLRTRIEFGYDDVNDRVIAVGPSVSQTTPTGSVYRTYSLINSPVSFFNSLSQYLGYGAQRLDPQAIAQVPPYILRTIQLRPGNYTADELAAAVMLRMNPLTFTQTADAQRTLNYKLPTGTPASLVIPYGRYTASELVNFLNSALNPAPANVTVSVDASTGKFTFTQQFGLPFMLLFDGADNVFTAANLGFETVNYSGSSTYSSKFNALQGVAVSDGGYGVNTYPSNTYLLSADPTQHHFTFDTGLLDEPQVEATSGTNDTVACPHTAVWNPVRSCTTLSEGWSESWYPGDVLYAQAPDIYGAIASFAGCSVTTAAAHGLVNGQSVTIRCNALAGTYTVTVTGATTFDVSPCSLPATTTGTGGTYASNSNSDGTATNTYTVVVQATPTMVFGGPPELELQPTVSIFSTLNAGTIHEALGEPAADRLITLESAQRDVFQLFFSSPDSKAANFGFPSVSWPPSTKTLQQFYAPAFPTYNSACQCVPVSNTYTSPYCWNLAAPDYILMLLCAPCGSKDVHTHTWKKDTKPILAKLYITSPYLNISEQMLFSTFAGFQRINQVSVEFQNPDGSLVEFNGRPHSYELLFTLYEDSANATCL